MNRDDDKRIGVRSLSLIALLLMTALLAACGGQSTPKPPPGSPQNPLVAQAPQDSVTAGTAQRGRPRGEGRSGRGAEGAKPKADAQPGYQKLVERQGSKPRSRFTPCNLVSKAQAGAIVGAPLQDPLEAPQGPTCIYRSQDGKRFVTLAVQSVAVREAQAPDAQAPAGRRFQQDRVLRDARTADPLRAALGQPRAQRRGAVPGGAQVRGDGPCQRLND